MSEQDRIAELADYLGVDVDEGASTAKIARALGCDEAYLAREPDLPQSAVTALARMGGELGEPDCREAQRFAAYLAHAVDD